MGGFTVLNTIIYDDFCIRKGSYEADHSKNTASAANKLCEASGA